MRRAVLFVLALGCGRADPPRASPAVDAAPPIAPAASLDEADFEGSFDGARLFATFAVHEGVVSGSLFYERVGVDLPITGSLAGDTLILQEMERGAAISVTTLTRQPSGAWAGTWKKGDRAGPASLSLVTRVAGAPVRVVTRIDRSKSAGCDGESVDGKQKKIRPVSTVRVPVVLGLADRAFERTLNDHLKVLAHDVTAKCPLGVEVAFRTPLNARGFLSVLFDTRYVSEPDVGVYAFTHKMNVSDGVNVAIDRARISTLDQIVDFNMLGEPLGRRLRAAEANCVTGPVDNPLELLETLVLTPNGAEFCYDACSNHVHSSECSTVTFGQLRGALRPSSAFAPLWSAAPDGG